MKWLSLLVSGMFCLSAYSERIILHNGGSGVVTTGDYLDNIEDVEITTNVVEITGLYAAARTGSVGHEINALLNSMGITTPIDGEDSDRFDFGEEMTLKFNKDVEITEVNMVGFSNHSNSVMVIAVGGQPDPRRISVNKLANENTETYTNSISVKAGTNITFYVENTNSVIGLQSMDVVVLGETEPLSLNLVMSNDWINVSANFAEPAAAHYVLQFCTNLTSNVWNRVGGPFTADTNWTFQTSNNAAFYRLKEE